MEFLYLLEGIRNPVFDFIFSVITYLGSEIGFIVISVVVFWCINKTTGYYILGIGFSGSVINQTLKLMFKIPRPWIKDPNFSIVESARAEATGYSFPSGHTQNAIGTFGGLAFRIKKAWIRFVIIGTAILVAFSRMYLGVHTPLDVGVSLAVATALVLIFNCVFKANEKKPSVMYVVLGVLLALSIAYLMYVLLYPFENVDETNYTSGLKTAYTLFGSISGMIVGYVIESRYIKFETNAVWWAQLIKASVGLGIALLIKTLLKQPLYALSGGELWADAIRYFVLVLFASCIWPLTFKFFPKTKTADRIKISVEK